MPRTSCLEMRKERLRRLLDVHYNLIIYQCVSGAIHCLIPEDDSDSDSDSERPVEFGLLNNMIICIVQELQRLDNIQYLAPHTCHIKSIEWREHLALYEPDHCFKACFRIHKSSFVTLLRLIHDHPVFHNNSINKQSPV